MQISLQRFLDRWVGSVLCALVSVGARFLPRPKAVFPYQVKHVLMIMLSEMGSMVLAGPMVAELRSKYPYAQLHILQLKKNQSVSAMLQLTKTSCMHGIDDSSLLNLLRSIASVTKSLRALPVDVVVDCELFSRISALLAFASGAPRIAGFTAHTQEGLYRGNFITHAVAYNPYRHISQQFLALVHALEATGIPRSRESTAPLPERTLLEVSFTPEHLANYRAKLYADHPTTRTAAPTGLVLMYAGGGLLPERAWPASYYANVAAGLCSAGHTVGLIGLPEDRALALQIQAESRSEHCLNLTGYTANLQELLLLMHQAQLLITNDGGPGHFASLTGIQVMMFFGPETSRLYGPLPNVRGKTAIVMESGVACSPCLTAYNHRKTFCDGDNQCLKRITPDSVLATALSYLLKGEA